MPTLYILRGVSGAGKSTLAAQMLDAKMADFHYEADMFWYDEDGNYNFNVKHLPLAHEWCRDSVRVVMDSGYNVIVSNTFTTEDQLKAYLDLAEEYKYRVVCLVVENRHGGNDIHNVPEGVKQKQERCLKNSIKLI